MMAFYASHDEQNRKSYHPTPEFENLLKQSVVTAEDLRVFRSSNQVGRLMEEVFKHRGFKHDASSKVWRRETLGGQLSEWANEHMKGLVASALKKPFVPDSNAQIAQLVMHRAMQYQMQTGRKPDTAFLPHISWLRLREYVIKAHLMSFESIAGSTKFVFHNLECISAEHVPGGIHVTRLADGPGDFSHSVAPYQEPIMKALMGGEKLPHIHIPTGKNVGKTQAGGGPIIKVKAAKNVKPKPRKIIPPSQLGRKLDL